MTPPRLGDRLDYFTPAECRNYFGAAGYDATWSALALTFEAPPKPPNGRFEGSLPSVECPPERRIPEDLQGVSVVYHLTRCISAYMSVAQNGSGWHRHLSCSTSAFSQALGRGFGSAPACILSACRRGAPFEHVASLGAGPRRAGLILPSASGDVQWQARSARGSGPAPILPFGAGRRGLWEDDRKHATDAP
jgi:hypothetical protein